MLKSEEIKSLFAHFENASFEIGRKHIISFC